MSMKDGDAILLPFSAGPLIFAGERVHEKRTSAALPYVVTFSNVFIQSVINRNYALF